MSLGNELAQQMKLVASNVTVIVLKDTGHWVLEERPKETTEALVKFPLAQKRLRLIGANVTQMLFAGSTEP